MFAGIVLITLIALLAFAVAVFFRLSKAEEKVSTLEEKLASIEAKLGEIAGSVRGALETAKAAPKAVVSAPAAAVASAAVPAAALARVRFGEEDPAFRVAVITAAIRAVFPKNYRILSISLATPQGETWDPLRSAWSVEGRRQIYGSHKLR